MVMARKRKNPDGSIKQPNPAKGLRRGIVKWAPPHIEGEDEASHARNVTWMHSEWKKKEKTQPCDKKNGPHIFLLKGVLNKGDGTSTGHQRKISVSI